LPHTKSLADFANAFVDNSVSVYSWQETLHIETL
jgi:hypothetical protein